MVTNPRLAARPETAPGARKGSPRLPPKAGRRRRQGFSHAGGWGAPSSLRGTREGPLRSPPRPVLTTRNAAETEEPQQAPPPAGSAPQEAARAGEARPLRAVVRAAAPLPGNINKRRVTSAESGTLLPGNGGLFVLFGRPRGRRSRAGDPGADHEAPRAPHALDYKAHGTLPAPPGISAPGPPPAALSSSPARSRRTELSSPALPANGVAGKTPPRPALV